MDPKDLSQAPAVVDPAWHRAVWISGAAFLGAFLRYQRWLNRDGKLVWMRLVFDIPGSGAFGIMAIGFSSYMWGDKVSGWTVGAIAGFFGMVGPSFLEAVARGFVGAKRDAEN